MATLFVPLGLFIFSSFLFHARPYMGAATLAYGILWMGLIQRKKRSAHVPLMASGIFLDFAIVGILEVKRQAIQTAISFTLSPLQQGHIATSTLALILYFPALYFGFRRWTGKGSQSERSLHLSFAKAAFAFRTLGFILMFSLFLVKPQ